MYTDEEIEEIRNILVQDKPRPTQEVAEIVVAELQTIKDPGRRALATAVAPLIAHNNPLYQKIMADEKALKHIGYGFFPEVFELCYYDDSFPSFGGFSANRGQVNRILHLEKQLVIKPVESPRESEIARLAGDLGVGPRQYESLDGFLTEDFISGTPFPCLSKEGKEGHDFYHLGRQVRHMMDTLHVNNIFYNDVILTDDMGSSHLLIQDDGMPKLVDFGASVLLDQHPYLTDDDVWNYARTNPVVALRIKMVGPIPKAKVKAIETFRPLLERASPEEIMARDETFVQEGMHFAGYRIGEDNVASFRKGYEATLD